RRRVWRRGHGHLEDAVGDRCPRLVGIDGFGQRNDTVEASVDALAAVESAVSRLVVLLPSLPGDHELTVPELDGDLVLAEAGDVGANHDLVSLLQHLDRRHPHRARAEAVEDPADVLHEPAHEGDRIGRLDPRRLLTILAPRARVVIAAVLAFLSLRYLC